MRRQHDRPTGHFYERAFTHDELLQFMTERWNTEEYSSFITDPSLKRYTDFYVLLPATERYMIIVYSIAAMRLFNRKDKVVISILNTPAGAREMML